MPPTSANGKICYVEIPAVDTRRSIDFYRSVFSWSIRHRSDGQTAFDDAVGGVSGTWVTGRPPSREPGLLLYIMVDNIDGTIEKVIEHGGLLVQPIGVDAPELTARFSDPAGNVIGLYQEPKPSATGVQLMSLKCQSAVSHLNGRRRVRLSALSSAADCGYALGEGPMCVPELLHDVYPGRSRRD